MEKFTNLNEINLDWFERFMPVDKNSTFTADVEDGAETIVVFNENVRIVNDFGKYYLTYEVDDYDWGKGYEIKDPVRVLLKAGFIEKIWKEMLCAILPDWIKEVKILARKLGKRARIVIMFGDKEIELFVPEYGEVVFNDEPLKIIENGNEFGDLISIEYK